MKAQFATIEALMSLAIALSSIGIAMHVTESYQRYSEIAYQNLSMGSAAYDFISELTSNELAESCLSLYYSEANPCIDNYTYYYERIYGIRDIGIIGSGGNANYSRTYCTNSTKSILCVGVS